MSNLDQYPSMQYHESGDNLEHIKELISAAWQTVTSNVEAAGGLIAQAKALSLSSGYTKGAEECLLLEARFDGEMDRYFDALHKASSVLQSYKDQNSLEGQIRANRVLGYLYSKHGKYNKALEHLFDALRKNKDSGIDVQEGIYPIQVFLLNNIAFIYADTGRAGEALSFFYQAFELAKKSSGSMISTILTNISEMHLNTGDTRMALRYNKMALTEIKRQRLGAQDLHNCYNIFGLIYKRMGQYEKALESLAQSLEWAEKGESKFNQIVSRLEVARLHLHNSNPVCALEMLMPALEMAEEIKANALLKDLCLVLAEASETTGDMAGSLRFYKRHMELNQELATREVEQRLSDYTAEFKAEQAQKDAEIYRLKNIELRQKSMELEESNKNLRLISEIGRRITATLDIDNVLNTIYGSIARIMDANFFAIGLYDAKTEVVDFKIIIENSERLPLHMVRLDENRGYTSQCIRSRQEIIINDLEEDVSPEEANSDMLVTNGIPPRSLIFCPLILAGEIVGVMTVQSYRPNAYSHNNIETVKAMASFIAVALNNSRISGELVQKANELELLSKTDPLTGIYNRRYIIEKMEEERARFRRYGKPFSLIILDIDFFKRVNDNLGHDCGDYVLAEVARLLRQTLREQDCLARWGGEEFLILLPETDAAGSEVLAERLRAGVEERDFAYNGKRVSITLTMGICQFGEGITIDEAIRKADNALYEGKNQGRNCVVVGS